MALKTGSLMIRLVKVSILTLPSCSKRGYHCWGEEDTRTKKKYFGAYYAASSRKWWHFYVFVKKIARSAVMHQYSGYLESVERLQQEAGAAISKVKQHHNWYLKYSLSVQFEPADNVDLNLMLTEYEAYYELRYDRKPKIVRKLKDGEEPTLKIPASRPAPEKKASGRAAVSSAPKEVAAKKTGAQAEETDDSSFVLQGQGVSSISDKKGPGDDSERLENRYI